MQSAESVLRMPDAICTVLSLLMMDAARRDGTGLHLVPASMQSAKSVLHTPDAVCTVLDS